MEVVTFGFLAADHESYYLYLTKDHAEAHDEVSAIGVAIDSSDCLGRYVFVRGTYSVHPVPADVTQIRKTSIAPVEMMPADTDTPCSLIRPSS
jgi:protein subunit release factor A